MRIVHRLSRIVNTHVTLNEYFDEIFCINLDSRPDRWKQCQELFKRHDLQVTRVRAVDGSYLPNPLGFLPGEVGCTASHLNVLAEIVSRCKRALILEDDVDFVAGLQARFDELRGDIPPWDMLYLSGNHLQPPMPVTPRVARLTETYTTSSYAVTRDFAAYLREHIAVGQDRIDIAYSRQHSKHRCYVTLPHLAWQRAGMSDIQGRWMSYGVMKP